jgi:hypothetical protein
VPVYALVGDAAGDEFGRSLAVHAIPGDVHLVIGAPLYDEAYPNAGEIVRYSAVTGVRFPGSSAGWASNDQWGRTLCSDLDWNGDGNRDLAVGAPTAGAGRVRLAYSNGGLLDLNGTQHGERLGSSLAGVGDIDQDGNDELLVGSMLFDNGTVANTGRIQLFGSATGTVLYERVGDSSQDQLGFAVVGLGDVDGDSVPDFAAGANRDDNGASNSGMVRVYSGASGATITSFNGSGATDELGSALAAPGDVDGDGTPDLLVGAPKGDQVNGADCGYARLFSGATGAILFTWRGDAAGDQLGAAVAAGGDWNADGRPELVVGAPFADANGVDSGLVRVFSGADGSLYAEFPGVVAGEAFGSALAVQELNGDAVPDLLVGAPLADGNGVDSGAAYFFSGACNPASVYCTAKTNSLGCLPYIVVVGTTCNASLEVRAHLVRNQKSGLLFYGVTGQSAAPFQGGTLCVAPPIRRTPATNSGGSPLPANDCSGVFSIDMLAFAKGQLGGSPLPALTLPGTLVRCQWWGRDPGFPAPNNTTLSNAAEYEVQ